ncbi:sigma 54-interacting transcriptional regulator [Kaarinaea lacus]
MSIVSSNVYNQFENGLDDQAVTVLIEAAKLIGQSLESKIAIQGLLQILSNRLHLDRGRVLLQDKNSKELHIHYSYGLSEEEQARGTYALGEGVTGKVMATGNIALIPNVALEPTYLARVTTSTQIGTKPIAYIAVPIIQEERTIGVLAVHPVSSEQNKLKMDLFVLQILAQMICQVLQINNMVKQKTEHLVSENKMLRDGKPSESIPIGIQGKSPSFLNAVQKATLAAKSDAAVLLNGESGSGKEKFARIIHQLSNRSDYPFICINCAAIPEQLLESELFGHERGSFTGATSNRVGKFELASGGTLFLDEIGDMPLELQSKLLRVLQEKSIQKIGSNREVEVDVRIISATNKNLELAVNSGKFRLDLFYRLNVVKIGLPPLRERKEDIRLLALHFLNRGNQRYQRNVILTPEALDVLEDYPWPGNIRQLENVIERAVIMSDFDIIAVSQLQTILSEEADIDIESNYKPNTTHPAGSNYVAVPAFPTPIRGYAKVQEQEAPRILEALQKANGNKTAAAKLLGMTPRQLHYRIKKLELPANLTVFSGYTEE